MRRRMLPVHVTCRGDRPHVVRWRDDGSAGVASSVDAPGPPGSAGPERVERIAHVLDSWEYAGRWWERERRRSYLLVTTERGSTLELFREGETWCLSRTSD